VKGTHSPFCLLAQVGSIFVGEWLLAAAAAAAAAAAGDRVDSYTLYSWCPLSFMFITYLYCLFVGHWLLAAAGDWVGVQAWQPHAVQLQL
jgi:hypothetical protein